MCIGLWSVGSLGDTNMFSHAFQVAEMLFCLLLLHRSNLESFSAARIRGEDISIMNSTEIETISSFGHYKGPQNV